MTRALWTYYTQEMINKDLDMRYRATAFRQEIMQPKPPVVSRYDKPVYPFEVVTTPDGGYLRFRVPVPSLAYLHKQFSAQGFQLTRTNNAFEADGDSSVIITTLYYRRLAK